MPRANLTPRPPSPIRLSIWRSLREKGENGALRGKAGNGGARTLQRPIKLLVKNYIRRDQYFHWNAHTLAPAKGYSQHYHDFHELFWIEEGVGAHTINAEHREMRPGGLVFVRAPDVHTISGAPETPTRIVNIAFRVETWEYLKRRYFQARFDPFANSPVGAREFVVPPADFTELCRMGRELGAQPRESRVAIERFLINLLCMVESLRPLSSPDTIPEWLRRACGAIAEGRNFERGTAAFAELAGKSPEHVARETRRWLKKTPTDIVNDARLAYAATRLATSSERIVDIALDCGFENLGHFYKLCRAKFGVSPRQYRLRQQRIVGL
jgi:AraC-like DNA-binding protein/mannose-6-phosphate isomerase-like protein (cupin superfamily)